MEHRLDELAYLVGQLAVEQHHLPVQEPARFCSICCSSYHPTYACTTLQYDGSVFHNHSVDATGVFLGEPQYQQLGYDPYSTTYNHDWGDHPWFEPYVEPISLYQQPMQQQQAPISMESEPTLEDLVKQFAQNNIQFQQRTEAIVQNVKTQVGQLTSSLSQLSKQQMQKFDSTEHETIDVQKPINDLCAEFASFTDFDDSVCCTGCDGDMLCNACAEIAAFLRHDESFSADYAATQSAEVVKQPKLEFIVAKNLLTNEEEKLLQILKENQRAIILADILSVSPSICMRRILLEDGE